MAHPKEQLWLGVLAEARSKLADLPGTERWQRELVRLHERLLANQHLVAVFGAFSAGKSSLINALIGDSLLVVSPNPTTAAVTHIETLPVFAGDASTLVEPEGTAGQVAALVTAKTEEGVWDDVRQAFESLHLVAANLDEAIAKAAALKPVDFAASLRKTVSFLRSTAAGYDAMRPRLGTTWAVGPEEFAKLTANEQFASYVNEVHIYHDAKVVQQGISLVDTPGVDSIHRRHTEVAFQYMRRADAVIFVLYYTHAFSRADKDFLLQLAGVQDVAGTDKLLVVINAVDLAKSGEEREAVRERVLAELKQAGIRQPQVFEVSSQVAFAAEQYLQGNQEEKLSALLRQRLHRALDDDLDDLQEVLLASGVPQFRAALLKHVNERAERLSAQTAIEALREVTLNLENQLRILVERQQQDASTLEKLAQARQVWLAEQQARLQAATNGEDALSQSLRAEWRELVFHAGERIRMRFGNLIREAFHPGRFRTASHRQALMEAGNELLTTLGRQVELECRTFALRAVKQAEEGLNSFLQEFSNELVALEASLEIPDGVFEPLTAIVENSYRANLDGRALASGYRHFSTPKHFFEDGGQRAFQQELESTMLPVVRQELERLARGVEDQALGHVKMAETNLLLAGVEGVQKAILGAFSPLSEQEVGRWTNVVDWFHHLPLSNHDF